MLHEPAEFLRGGTLACPARDWAAESRADGQGGPPAEDPETEVRSWELGGSPGNHRVLFLGLQRVRGPVPETRLRDRTRCDGELVPVPQGRRPDGAMGYPVRCRGLRR